MAIDWTKLFVDYKGQWIALKDDEKTVIEHGKSAKSVLQNANAKGFEKPIMLKVPKKTSTYIG